MKKQIQLFGVVMLAMLFAPGAQAVIQCDSTITANVVVLDNPTVFNRLGAQNPNWITYALERDVVHWDDGNPADSNNGVPCTQIQGGCTAGMVQLRPDKRPRPLVMRSVAGSCLTVTLTNLLDTIANPNNAQANTPNPAFPVLEPDLGVNCADPANAANRVCILNNNDQVAGRCAGFHASGTELRNMGLGTDPMANDGSMVGNNDGADIGDSTTGDSVCGPGMVAPGETTTYNLYTPHEGAFVINSYGATLGSEQGGGNLGMGMFGVLNVQPVGASMYRSIVTEEEMRLATNTAIDLGVTECGVDNDPAPGRTCLGQPIINYEATYPNDCGTVDNGDGTFGDGVWCQEGKAGLPVLNMLAAGNELVHTDINAIIVGDGPNGTFTADTYPLESVGKTNPALPQRLEPFREFTSIFHDEQANTQVFPRWYQNPVLNYTLAGVKDAFMINYGSGGIGSEIIANRLHTGPMHDCTDCAYEEFFLASQTVGDPGQLVNYPANSLIESCDPTNIVTPDCWRQFLIDADVNGDGVVDPGGEAVGANPPIPNNYALYQEDPSNVHHSYVGDSVKIRNTHVGAFEQHIFHLHNHQWLFNPNDDNANYLDAQEIMPGSGHTYELVYGGAGNRNKTAGDAIFHCHFYPHFAQGMWYHIRIQDTFEEGSLLATSTAAGDKAGNNDLNGDGFHDQRWALRSGQPAAGARALPDGELPDGVPIPAVVPLPGKAMPEMPGGVSLVAVDRGDFGVLSGRRPAGGVLNQGPDSSQAVVDMDDVAAGMNPGYPFWAAGNNCGVGAVDTGDPATVVCPEGTVGQRMPTPPLDMLTVAGAGDIGAKQCAVANIGAACTTDADCVEGNGAKAVSGTCEAVNPLFGNVVAGQAGGWDGGLPRHNLRGYTSGGVSLDTQNRLDFRKIVEIAQPVYFPEVGTPTEQAAMAYHSQREIPSFANNLDGTPSAGNFVLNGATPVPGGPFNDPCIDDTGLRLGVDGGAGNWFDGTGGTSNTGTSPFDSDDPRTYKVANVQIDAVFNKVGWHYPQERIIALWGDVEPSILKQRPPEPLVMRFNTFDCGKILHTNLVPAEFELDDFQVRTPTDIIGQHIHLPKWDLTTNDGAANGWNYEDGTLSPHMVEERILAISRFNALAGGSHNLVDLLLNVVQVDPGKLPGGLLDLIADHTVDLTDLSPVLTIPTGDSGGTPAGLGCVEDPVTGACPGGLGDLHALPHPFFGHGVGGQHHTGARTTIQRILVDPLYNVAGVDRGLGMTFSHDHYGPSTFQQIGLYSTILAEPAGSTWVHNESGDALYGRNIGDGVGDPQATDGGPTSWQAIIQTAGNPDVPDHREFYFEMSDFQHAYEPGVYVGADDIGNPIQAAINQPQFIDVTTADAPALHNTWQDTINPPLKLKSVPFPDVVTAEALCPGPLNADGTGATNASPFVKRPCAEAINISHSSMFVVNYRNEPVGLRVFDPNTAGPDGKMGTQTAGDAGDLALALQSRTDRAIPQLNTEFGDMPYPVKQGCDGINCDRREGDPITPIVRAYQGDNVKIKIQVGATEEQHQATIHGMKWLSNGSGFGRSPNSGWRNFQSHGISEQFSLQAPVNPDLGQAGNRSFDSFYATDATRDGIWLGSWGLIRTYNSLERDLTPLSNNQPPRRASIDGFVVNADEFNGVCPINAPVTTYDVTAVLANDVLPNNLGVTIPANTQIIDPLTGAVLGGDSDGDGIGDNNGGPLNTAGGTLVYNRRGTSIQECAVAVEEGGTCAPADVIVREGPLNDPTAMMYVRTEDLVIDEAARQAIIDGGGLDPCVGIDPVTGDAVPSEDLPNPVILPGCPATLAANAPVEPLVLRANAGDCIEVALRNRLPAVAPDLAGWQDMMWGVKRNIQIDPVTGLPEMHFFNNNLIRPSSLVGLHPQLVEYDVTRHDGTVVGQRDLDVENGNLALPGSATTARWYAGDLAFDRVTDGQWMVTATPIEFGGSNLLSADRVKQSQKGLFGALSILPQGSTVAEITQVPDGQGSGSDTRLTRAQATVTAPDGAAGSGGVFRENLLVGHKIANARWKDGSAIKNIHQGELGREGAEDSGHAGFNYGMEPSWFRFMLPPDAPFGNAITPNSFGSIPNQQAMYANLLTIGEPNAVPAIPGVSAAGDPATPVFRANAGQASRIHVLNGSSADRDGTFILHGHVWQRDPFVCPGESDLGLTGKCLLSEDSVDSRALGLNPIGKYMGGEEGMGHAYGHWPILFDAGGTDAVSGDFLFRDYTPSGNRNGQFGILRVE